MEFVNMTAKEYRQMISGGKGNKYHAEKTAVGGVVFDSRKESRDWERLCMLEKMGVIHDLKRQVKFELQPEYINNKGEKIRPINYLADFTYIKEGKKYAVDSKSEITKKDKTYRLKKKMFEYRYQDWEFLEI